MGAAQRGRRVTLGAALVSALVMGLPGTAAAAVPSSVSLAIQDGYIFKGKVTSAAPGCVVGRRVQLVRIEPDGSRTIVDVTYATESGRYRTEIPMQAGNRFFARIRRVETPSGKVCLADRSVTRIA